MGELSPDQREEMLFASELKTLDTLRKQKLRNREGRGERMARERQGVDELLKVLILEHNGPPPWERVHPSCIPLVGIAKRDHDAWVRKQACEITRSARIRVKERGGIIRAKSSRGNRSLAAWYADNRAGHALHAAAAAGRVCQNAESLT